jgi:AraC-like DNA-binding protein
MSVQLLYIQYKHPSTKQVSAHLHPFHELVYIIEGEATIYVAGARRRYAAPVLLLYPPGVVHREEHDAGSWFAHVVVGIAGSGLPDAVQAVPDHADRRFRQLLLWLLESTSAQQAAVSEALLGLLVAYLGDSVAAPASDESAHSRLSPALTYIAEHLTRPIRVADLADVVHVSESYLQYLFKEELAQSPIRVIMQERYQQAGHLLQESDLSIKAIALRCGFQDQRYFARFFKRMSGMTPTQYRQRAQRS